MSIECAREVAATCCHRTHGAIKSTGTTRTGSILAQRRISDRLQGHAAKRETQLQRRRRRSESPPYLDLGVVLEVHRAERRKVDAVAAIDRDAGVRCAAHTSIRDREHHTVSARWPSRRSSRRARTGHAPRNHGLHGVELLLLAQGREQRLGMELIDALLDFLLPAIAAISIERARHEREREGVRGCAREVR